MLHNVSMTELIEWINEEFPDSQITDWFDLESWIQEHCIHIDEDWDTGWFQYTLDLEKEGHKIAIQGFGNPEEMKHQNSFWIYPVEPITTITYIPAR